MSIHTPKWGNLSPERRQAFERTITSAAGGGSNLIQDYISRVIEQLTLREFGLTSVLDRKRGSGSQVLINDRTPGAAGATWLADNAAPTEYTGTYSRSSLPFQTLATRGTVSRKLMAMGASYSDILADEMAAKAEDFVYELETGAAIGISTAGIGTANEFECNGFLTQVNAAGTDQLVDVSTSGPVAAGALTLAAMDEMIDKVKGSMVKSDLVIVVSQAMGRALNALLDQNQRFVNMVEIAAGFRVKSYDGIPIVTSTAMPDNGALPAAGAIPVATDTNRLDAWNTAGTNSGSILCLNRRYAWIEELTPMTVLPLAKTTSASDSFDMYMDLAYVLSNSKGGAAIIGVSSA